MAKHATHNPSSAGYWLHCGYWYHHKIAAEAAGEDWSPDSDASRRGRRLHLVAEKALERLLDDEEWSVTKVANVVADVIDQHQLTEDLSEEDADQASSALIAVLTFLDALEPEHGPFEIMIEARVPLSHEPQSRGTVDVALVGPDLLAVLDYKFGAGEVEPDAEQFWVYASNLARKLTPRSKVLLGVVQPQLRDEVLYHQTTWDQLVEFRGHVNHTVRNQLAGAAYPPSELATCGHCPFQSRCVGYAQLVTSSATVVFDSVNDAQIEWVVANRTAIVEGVEVLAGVVKEQAERFPNWSRKVVENPAKWNPGVEEGEIAHQLRLKGVREPYTLKTPAAIRDEYPDLAGVIDKFVLDRGTHVRLLRPSTAPDLRAEIKTREIREVIEAKAAAKAAKAEAKAKKGKN